MPARCATIFAALLAVTALRCAADVCSARDASYRNVFPQRQFCLGRLPFGVWATQLVGFTDSSSVSIGMGADQSLASAGVLHGYVSNLYDSPALGSIFDQVWARVSYRDYDAATQTVRVSHIQHLDDVEGAADRYASGNSWVFERCALGSDAYAMGPGRCECRLGFVADPNTQRCERGCSLVNGRGFFGDGCSRPAVSGMATVNQHAAYVRHDGSIVCLPGRASFGGECRSPGASERPAIPTETHAVSSRDADRQTIVARNHARSGHQLLHFILCAAATGIVVFMIAVVAHLHRRRRRSLAGSSVERRALLV